MQMAEYRFRPPKISEGGKRKPVWPALLRSLPANTKTNGRLGFLKIGKKPGFPK